MSEHTPAKRSVEVVEARCMHARERRQACGRRPPASGMRLSESTDNRGEARGESRERQRVRERVRVWCEHIVIENISNEGALGVVK